jgi:O-acetyl-ADP-ribose deacetylase (regulator of RNase III)
MHDAARIALREIDAHLAGDTQMAQVLVVCFDERARAAHAEARRELGI